MHPVAVRAFERCCDFNAVFKIRYHSQSDLTGFFLKETRASCPLYVFERCCNFDAVTNFVLTAKSSLEQDRLWAQQELNLLLVFTRQAAIYLILIDMPISRLTTYPGLSICLNSLN